MVGSSTQWVKNRERRFPKVSREKRGTVSREVSREHSVLGGSMDEEDQKCMVTYCSDRYAQNTDKQLCIEC